MKRLTRLTIVLLTVFAAQSVLAANFIIDKEGMHAAINFKIKHLGYSWLTGRFNDFDGSFSYDAKYPEASQITVNINPASIDSNHELRDKHLRGDDFLDVAKHKTAKFVSTKVSPQGDGKLQIAGNLTLHGVTRQVIIDAEEIGSGKDPWGGYRHGFSGTTSLKLKDFGIDFNLGPASTTVVLELHIEGIRQ